MSGEQTIAEIGKNKKEKILVTISEYKGNPYVNLRVWAESPRGLIPTKKGITFSPKLLKSIIEALQDAETKIPEPTETPEL